MKAFPREIPDVKKMVTRHIGVESELGVNDGCGGYNYSTEEIVNVISKDIGKRGLLQSIGCDGGGREFRTNPISIKSLNQVRGFKYVTEYYGILAKSTQVLNSGGTHIHISILNNDHENMESNAMAMAIAFYPQFQKIAGRQSNWAGCAAQATLEQVRTYLADRKRGDSRAYSLKGSMLNPTYHQTLEFRGGRGSNNSEEVLAWVEFLNNVVKRANHKSVEGVAFKDLLKGKRIEAYLQTLTDWRVLTDKELNHKFNGKKLRERSC